MKLQLYTKGIRVSPNARERLGGAQRRPLTMADYASTSGITLKLEEDIWVNAPIADFNPNFVDASTPFTLDFRDPVGFVVCSADSEIRAEPVRVPAYATEQCRNGVPFAVLAVTHSDRVRISPIQGCAIVCKFCDFPYQAKYRPQNTEDLVEAVERALDDPLNPAKHVLISGGTPQKRDYGYLNRVYDEVIGRCPGVDVDIMMAPMPGLLDPKRLKALGVNALSINLELFGPQAAEELMASKFKLSRGRYLDFIESAVEVFGPTKVRSLIMVGLEPIENTLRAVDALAKRGCEPLLSAFRPDPKTPLAAHPPPSAEFLEEVYLRSREIVEKTEVRLGPRCIACQHNVLTFPDGSDYYFYY